MAKANSGTLFKCNIFSPRGPVTLKGELKELSEGNSIKFKYKKPRSSRYAIKVIPWADVIYYNETTISYYSPRALIKTVLASVEVEKTNNMAILTTEQKDTIHVKLDCLDAVADDDSIQTEIKSEKSDKSKKKTDKPKELKKAA